MKTTRALLLFASLCAVLRADLTLPAIIGDHMVLQQQQADPIWGWDSPGTKVTVSFAGQTQTATAGPDGKWIVKLAVASASALPQTLTIAGSTTREIHDVLVGEVWMCSGQSNMGFQLSREWNGDLEAAAIKWKLAAASGKVKGKRARRAAVTGAMAHWQLAAREYFCWRGASHPWLRHEGRYLVSG